MAKKSARKKSEESSTKFCQPGEIFDNKIANDIDSSEEEEEEPEFTPKKSNKKVQGHGDKGHVSSSEEEEEESESSSSEEEEESEEEGVSDQLAKKMSKSKISKNANSISTQTAEKEWKRIEVSMAVLGNSNEFRENSEKAVMRIKGDASSRIFGNKDASSTLIQGKDSKKNSNDQQHQHILKSVELVKLVSTFPFSVDICIDGIDVPETVFTSSGGNKGAVYTAFPNEVNLNMNKVVVEGNALSKNNGFLQNFPGVNLKNVAKGVTFADDNKTAFVSIESPVWAMFEQTCRDSNTKYSKKITNGFGTMQADQAKHCLSRVQDVLEKDIQVKDLSKISFHLSRAFTGEKAKHGEGEQWGDNTELKDISSDVKQTFNQKGSVHATFAYTYRDI
jgi:hypothetical protein